jgi:hypothetical protein
MLLEPPSFVPVGLLPPSDMAGSLDLDFGEPIKLPSTLPSHTANFLKKECGVAPIV